MTLYRSQHGALTVQCACGNMAKRPGRDQPPGFRPVHSVSDKNATDLLLAVEAVALMLDPGADTQVTATSDGDFSHLAPYLTERALPIIGTRQANAQARFRKSRARFIETAQPSPQPTPVPASMIRSAPSAAPAKILARPTPLNPIRPQRHRPQQL